MSNKAIWVTDLLAGGIYEVADDLFLLVRKNKEANGLFLRWFSFRYEILYPEYCCSKHDAIYAELFAPPCSTSATQENQSND